MRVYEDCENMRCSWSKHTNSTSMKKIH